MPIPTGISASRGAAIFNLTPKYKSPLVAWIELMEQLQPGFCAANGYELPVRIPEWEEPLNPKMASIRFGHAFEDAICDLTGGITDREKFYQNDSHGFPMTCHIDGLKNGRVQENKTAFDMAFKMGWGEPGTDMVPESYQVQIQQQLYLTGLKHGDFNVLVFPKSPAEWERMGYRVKLVNGRFLVFLNNHKHSSTNDFAFNLSLLGYFHHFHVESNPSTQKTMIENYKLFWNDNVLKEVPPPVNGYDDIKWLIAAPEGEIEASKEMKELWSEYVDIDNEIESMVERKKEIKDNFAGWVQKEIESKNIKPGNEKRKLNIFAGPRKLFSITRAFPGLSVNKSMVAALKEDDPQMYEIMKKTSFADIMPESLLLTDKQKEKLLSIDEKIREMDEILLSDNPMTDDIIKEIKTIRADHGKLLKSLKLTKLLSKDSIMKHLEKHKPDMFKMFYERGIVEQTSPKSTLRISKPEKD